MRYTNMKKSCKRALLYKLQLLSKAHTPISYKLVYSFRLRRYSIAQHLLRKRILWVKLKV